MKIYGPRDSNYGPENSYEYDVGEATVVQEESGVLGCVYCTHPTAKKRTSNCKHCKALKIFLDKPLEVKK